MLTELQLTRVLGCVGVNPDSKDDSNELVKEICANKNKKETQTPNFKAFF